MNEVDEGHAFIHDERMEVLAAGVVCVCVQAFSFVCVRMHVCMQVCTHICMHSYVCMWACMRTWCFVCLSE